MQEITPEETTRAYAYDMWMKAPMPMVTLIRMMDVSNLRKISRRKGKKFNMLLCWCIGKAASRMEEFFILPVKDKLIKYEELAVNAIIRNSQGSISSCDVPFSESLERFNQDYLRLTSMVASMCVNHDLQDRMVIGTSALVNSRIDGAVGIYSGIFNNPFLIWGKFRKSWFRSLLAISFQFHHTQMDGVHAARFLDLLQAEIYKCK